MSDIFWTGKEYGKPVIKGGRKEAVSAKINVISSSLKKPFGFRFMGAITNIGFHRRFS